MKMFKEFKAQLPYVLSEIYKQTPTGSIPHNFVLSMFDRYKDAYAKGAIFFGPVAAIPLNDKRTQWIIKDLRGGWGFNHIDLRLNVDNEGDLTLEYICQELKNHARDIRSKANSVESLAQELSE